MNLAELTPCEKYTDKYCFQMDGKDLHRLRKQMAKEIAYLQSLVKSRRTDGTMPVKEYTLHKRWENETEAEIAKRLLVIATVKLALNDQREASINDVKVQLGILTKEIYNELMTWDLEEYPHVEAMLRKYESLIQEARSINNGANRGH